MLRKYLWIIDKPEKYLDEPEVWSMSRPKWKDEIVGELKIRSLRELKIWSLGDLKIWSLAELKMWNLGELKIWSLGELKIWSLGEPKSTLSIPHSCRPCRTSLLLEWWILLIFRDPTDIAHFDSETQTADSLFYSLFKMMFWRWRRYFKIIEVTIWWSPFSTSICFCSLDMIV